MRENWADVNRNGVQYILLNEIRIWNIILILYLWCKLPLSQEGRRDILETSIDGIERCVLTLVYLSFK